MLMQFCVCEKRKVVHNQLPFHRTKKKKTEILKENSGESLANYVKDYENKANRWRKENFRARKKKAKTVNENTRTCRERTYAGDIK